jgi:membrane protein DedA with SNARE-associated domain
VVLPLAKFTAYHGLGIALAAWAVIVAALGFSRSTFPKSTGGLRAVMAITFLLVAGTITAAIATSERHGKHETAHGDRANPTAPGESPENRPQEQQP